MLELVLLVPSVWAIVRRARQRHVNPTWFAVGALLGWLFFPLVGTAVLAPPSALFLRWACVGCIAVAVEFARPDPSLQPWSCPECGALNEAAALTCACRRVRPDLR
jgi:ribosomal protein S27E